MCEQRFSHLVISQKTLQPRPATATSPLKIFKTIDRSIYLVAHKGELKSNQRMKQDFRSCMEAAAFESKLLLK
jgi:hypothetical protein